MDSAVAPAHQRRRGGAGNHLDNLPFAALRFHDVGEGPPRLDLSQRSRLVVEPAAGFVPLVYALQRPDHRESAIVLGVPTGDLHGSETEARKGRARHSCAPKPRATLCSPRPAGVLSRSHGESTPANCSYHESQLANGRLTADDVIERGHAASLAVFSGCVTVLAERCPGDELIGLDARLRSRHSVGRDHALANARRSGAPFFRAFYDAVVHGPQPTTRCSSRRPSSAATRHARSRALGSLCPHGRLALT